MLLLHNLNMTCNVFQKATSTLHASFDNLFLKQFSILQLLHLYLRKNHIVFAINRVISCKIVVLVLRQ